LFQHDDDADDAKKRTAGERLAHVQVLLLCDRAQMPPQRTIAEPFNISATTMMVSQVIGEWYRGRRLSSRLGAGDATEPHYR
jgi:hypothetical protein